MVLPNFIGIGAQRAATTWVYNCLKEHPEVLISEEKELHFFNRNFDKGVAWYEAHFAQHRGQKAIGEITPNYLNHEEAIPRMAQVVPRARLFAILREPVDRAFSAYTLFRKDFPGQTFAEACRTSPYLVKLGRYAEHLERVFKYYPREQVKLFLYEDVKTNAPRFLTELFTFLAIDPSFRPSNIDAIYNRIMYPRTQRVLERVGLKWAVETIKQTPLGEWIKKRHNGKGNANEREKLDPTTTQELRQLFRDDVQRLQDMIGRDLSAWL